MVISVAPCPYQRARYEDECSKANRYIFVPWNGILTLIIPDLRSSLPAGVTVWLRITRITIPHGASGLILLHPYPIWINNDYAKVHDGSLYIRVTEQDMANGFIKIEYLAILRLRQRDLAKMKTLAIYSQTQLASTKKTTVITADFVIVGGGTAGCVLAARLAERGFETLLISSGSNDTSNPMMRQKSEFARLQRTLFFKHYLPSNASPNLNNRTLDAIVWKTLGGNSVNGGGMERMMANDWNSFVDATRDTSFHHENMSRYYKMVENFTSTDSSLVSNIHGNNGPIKITQAHDTIFKEVWKNVAYELNEAFSEDLADNMDHGLSFEPSSYTDGLRSWSGDAYLTPNIAKYPNLKVMTSTTAIKFNLNETTKRIDNILFLSFDGFFYGVAKKEYILSAGTFYSPHILMLSGIGDPEILQKHQIPVKHELRQVGKHMMDNGAIIVRYKTENLPINQSIPVGDQLMKSHDQEEVEENLFDFEQII
ncbi:unnamed protein product [Rotaria sp. Silwood1]|nr:unnamed protein product [Rotaria sp. Silwood1]CAF1613396.1 unnamed protein product [Rotaria sp. Silwood1]